MIDYMVMEAVAIKASKEDQKAQRNQERRSFKRDFSSLDRFR